MIKCQHCRRDFKNAGALSSHQRACEQNPERNPWNHTPWNKGKTGLQIPWNKGVKGRVIGWNKGMKGLKGTSHTKETKERLSKIAKERNLGGYVKGSGRGKKGWYKGFFCDSSWELAYVIYCLEHNINIKRNEEKRKYKFKNVEKTYIPDFIVEGEVIEIKGYKTEEWIAKLAANPDVKVLYEKDLKEILEYVKSNYGKNFIDLYE